MSFLFLSKLLALFAYPLGLVSVLLVVALLLWWKNTPLGSLSNSFSFANITISN